MNSIDFETLALTITLFEHYLNEKRNLHIKNNEIDAE